MNKYLKKVCGFLCVGIAAFAVGSVKASKYDQKLAINKIENGKFSGTATVGVAIEGVMGDVNEDGKVDLTDAQSTLKEANGEANSGVTNGTLANMDGEPGITVEDAKLVLRVALHIDEMQATQWESLINSTEITGLNYVIVNGTSELYDDVETYLSLAASATSANADSVYSKWVDLSDKLNDISKVSTNKTTIDGFLGTKKVNNVYVAYKFDLEDGTSMPWEIYKLDTSNASNWEFLNNTTEDNNDETTKEENKNEQTSKEETKVDVETETEIKTETKVETKKETKTEAKEETVENPETGITISLIGSIIVAIAGVVVKKKNLLSRI